jgi:acylphosphatase
MRVQVSLRAHEKGTVKNRPFFLFSPLSLHFRRIPRNLPATMNVKVHLVVTGLVQGVGFRYFVYHKAHNLGLSGYVRNLFSDDVEIEAEGDRSLVEELIKYVKIGPRAAQVKDVKIEWIKCSNIQSRFEVR